ncbi:hypothetical protein GGR27_003211 [Lewinella antarctica]|uniref:Uncharacterized protein n=1 Tax=Neolewinella antarctica TaxID=442734 RepID=A0ABX0XFL4_9BACT|nr:hypothetical protein [Neolewinella antarctica]
MRAGKVCSVGLSGAEDTISVFQLGISSLLDKIDSPISFPEVVLAKNMSLKAVKSLLRIGYTRAPDRTLRELSDCRNSHVQDRMGEGCLAEKFSDVTLAEIQNLNSILEDYFTSN